MFLNERKVQILMAIIDDYIKNAEPIGSRTIMKRYNIGVSPATIRNEMSDLEELGLLMQPHTSAGRIPSEKAYRFYVNELMKHKELDSKPIANIKEILKSKLDNPDELIREVAKVISKYTNYAAIVTKAQDSNSIIKHIKLISIDKDRVLLVVVINKDIIKNHIFNSQVSIDQDELDMISKILNGSISNHSLRELNIELVQRVGNELGEYKSILPPILEVIANTIKSIDKPNCCVAGVKNILEFPEFDDIEKARDMVKLLDETEYIVKILNQYSEDNNKIKVRIGSENGITQVDQCSIVSGNYRINDHLSGTIAIIGPIRMDYVSTITLLDNLIKQINMLI